LKTIIVTHRDDVDGIISGALLRRIYGPGAKIIFCSYPKQEEVFRQLAELAQGAQICIADIAAKDFPLPGERETVLELIASRAEKLEWYDHHSDTADFVSLFEKYGHKVILGESICATELILRNLLPRDWYAEFLARIAQTHDYPVVGSTGMSVKAGIGLQKIILYFNSRDDINGLTELANMIARDHLWYLGDEFCSKLNCIIFTVEAQIARAHEAAFKNRMIIEIEGRKFVITCANEVLYDKKTLVDLRDEFVGEVDGVMVYFLPPRSHALFYRGTQSDFDAQKFCKFMGGGGRDGDKGGFSSPIKYSQEEFGLFLTFMTKRLDEFIENGGG